MMMICSYVTSEYVKTKVIFTQNFTSGNKTLYFYKQNLEFN